MSGKKPLKNLLSNSKESLSSSKKFLYKYEDLSLYKKALDGYIKKSNKEEKLAKITNAGAYQRERYSNKSPSGALMEEYLHFPKNNKNLQKLENNYIAKPMNNSDYQTVKAIKTLIEYFEEKGKKIQILLSKQYYNNTPEIAKEIDEEISKVNTQIIAVKLLLEYSNTYKTSTINEIASDHIEDKLALSDILNIIGHLKANDLNGKNEGSTNESKEFISKFLTILNTPNYTNTIIEGLNQIKSSYSEKTVDIDIAEEYSKTIRAIRAGEFEQEIEKEYRELLKNREIKEEDLLKMTPETFRDFSLEAMNKLIIKKTFLETLHKEEWYENLLEEIKEIVEKNDIDQTRFDDFVKKIDSNILIEIQKKINLNIQAIGESSTFPFNILGIKWIAEKIGKEFPINECLLRERNTNFNIDLQDIFNSCINKEEKLTPISFEAAQSKLYKKFSPLTISLISSNMANITYNSRKMSIKKVNVLRHREEGISHNILTQNPQNVSGIASLKNEIDSRRKQIRLTNARLATFQKDKKKNYFEIKKKIDELEREKFVLAEAERRLYNLEKKILLEIKTRNFSNLKGANEEEIISSDSVGDKISNKNTQIDFTITTN